MVMAVFAGRNVAIATMHGKETVIGPPLEQALGVRCVTPEHFDTDALGTFTGEIERTRDPLETAREKCRRAMAATGCELAVASEGSFGPDPRFFFVPADDELLVMLDARSQSEWVVREVSTETNFANERVGDESALLAFAERAGFPEHALILRESAESNRDIYKGIVERDELLSRFAELQSRHGEVTVETDMRAHLNPSRRAVIARATQKLVALLCSTCPACSAPGFSVTDVIRGLPCGGCGLPTDSPSRTISRCQQCGHQAEQRNPQGKTHEDPMYCAYCNP